MKVCTLDFRRVGTDLAECSYRRGFRFENGRFKEH